MYEHCIGIVRDFNGTERDMGRTICLLVDGVSTKLKSRCVNVAASLSDGIVKGFLLPKWCCLRDVSSNPEVAATCMHLQRLENPPLEHFGLASIQQNGDGPRPQVYRADVLCIECVLDLNRRIFGPPGQDMGLGVADLERHSPRVHEISIYEKRETERNERPHVGRDNERRRGERGDGGRWLQALIVTKLPRIPTRRARHN